MSNSQSSYVWRLVGHLGTHCVDFGFEAIWKVTSSYMPKVLDGPATHGRRHNYKDSNTFSVFIFWC